jgi:hypothetical protein
VSHTHGWSRWIRGRRTGLWFRHCVSCGECERSETKQPDQERPRGMPDAWYGEDVVYIRQRMEKFTTSGARQAWRTVKAGGEM